MLSLKRSLTGVLFAGTVLASPAFAQTTLEVAIIGEPQSLDPMVSTQDVVSIVTQHFVETLYTFDSAWKIVPLLATELPTISGDGKTYTITLRDGITFHDGSTMDSADVVASLNRWLKVATRGKTVVDKVEAITAPDAHTVEIKLSAPYAPLLSLLAFSNSAAAVYPEEILGQDQLDKIIGTGPYELVEHKPDQYIQVAKFDGYVSRDEPSDGNGGARQQAVDEIRFVPVPDPNTRVEGLLSGQFDYADGLPVEAYERIASSDVAEPVLLESFGWPVWAINHKAGLLTDLNIRKALQAALPYDDMLFAAFGDDKFFKVDGAMYPEGWPWRVEDGLDLYNINDPEKAKEYLDAAGYDGTPLRILTSRQYEFHFKMAEVAQMMLEAAGFTVQMDVVDWATLGQRRDDPALWDIYISHSPFLPEPALTDMYAPSSRIGWSEPEKDKTWQEFTAETDPAKRLELFGQLQKWNMEDVGFIKVGDFAALQGKSKALKGVVPSPWPAFWNATVE
jgi:peptide/nickel transport system substrate-binding protein